MVLSSQHKTHATCIGFLAIIMWSFMVTLTAYTGSVPPFLLTAVAMFIGAMPGLVQVARYPQSLAQFKQPWPVWIIGIGGLFGYHFFYFTALRTAPPAEASLINYLWPLLIVLGSALMPGEKLHWYHVVGALLGFSGTILVVTKAGSFGFDTRYTGGYLTALTGSIIFATYSLLSRHLKGRPTLLVALFCLGSSLLSFVCHFIFAEPDIWPQNLAQWMAMAGLGLFPVGLAFYCWDKGVKQGNIQILGAASYATPMISTILLVVFGLAEPSWRLGIACILITAGAILASKNIIFQSRAVKKPKEAAPSKN